MVPQSATQVHLPPLDPHPVVVDGWTLEYRCIIPGERETILVRHPCGRSYPYFGEPVRFPWDEFPLPFYPEYGEAPKYCSVPPAVRTEARFLLLFWASREYLDFRASLATGGRDEE